MKTLKLPMLFALTLISNGFAAEPRGDNNIYHGNMDFSGIRYLGHLKSETHKPYSFFLNQKNTVFPCFGIIDAVSQEEANILHTNIIKKHEPNAIQYYLHDEDEYNELQERKVFQAFKKRLVPKIFAFNSQENYYTAALALFSYNKDTKKDMVHIFATAGKNFKSWWHHEVYLIQKKGSDFIITNMLFDEKRVNDINYTCNIAKYNKDHYIIDINQVIQNGDAAIVIMSNSTHFKTKNVAFNFAKEVLNKEVRKNVHLNVSHPFYQEVEKLDPAYMHCWPSNHMVMIIPLKKK